MIHCTGTSINGPSAVALARREVIDDGPAGNEEGGAELQAVEHPEEAVDAHAGTEAALLEIGEAALGLLGLAEQEAGFGVDVEREDGGGLVSLRPPVAHHGRRAPRSMAGQRILAGRPGQPAAVRQVSVVRSSRSAEGGSTRSSSSSVVRCSRSLLDASVAIE